jgi:hypothetical protein
MLERQAGRSMRMAGSRPANLSFAAAAGSGFKRFTGACLCLIIRRVLLTARASEQGTTMGEASGTAMTTLFYRLSGVSKVY